MTDDEHLDHAAVAALTALGIVVPQVPGNSLDHMTAEQKRSLLGVYAVVLLLAAAVNSGLQAAGYGGVGRAISLLTLLGVLTHAFLRSGRSTRPARTWAQSWRRRHLLLIGMSVAIGFSPLLFPSLIGSGWLLAPILLACVPLGFTPLGHVQRMPPVAEQQAPKPWQRDAERRGNDTQEP